MIYRKNTRRFSVFALALYFALSGNRDRIPRGPFAGDGR
jgi:hypothetical protein